MKKKRFLLPISSSSSSSSSYSSFGGSRTRVINSARSINFVPVDSCLRYKKETEIVFKDYISIKTTNIY